MYNLQEDLEMSDSDDEMVPEVKNPPVEYLKSPANGAMDAAPPALSARSSSSDSCDSDSEESSSESNDSDSSASSEASGVGAHSKQSAPQMWGLSNFFDETRRNHSPAFIPMDNNTNSSTAVKEEPIRSVGTERDSFSLVDEDSINLLLGKYSDPHIKEYHRSPMNEMVDMEGAPVAIKTEILSPISSPIRSPPRPIVPIRGPRTPPTPPSPIKEPDDEEEETEELHSQPTFIRSKSPRNSQPLHSQNKSKVRSEGRDDGSKVQSEKSKKQNRNKNESVSPRVKASPASSNYADDEVFSASKSFPDIPANKEKDAITVVSCPVPSESLEFGREASLKSRHKHSMSSSKKAKSHSETSDILEKRSSSSKSHVSKSKHSSAKQQTTQSSSSTRQSSTAKVKGAGSSDDVKKRSKSDCKEKRSESSSKRSSRDASASNNSGHSHKSVSKTSSKSKSKSRSPKRVHESKKSDGKKKRKKFSIKNFLQSPTFSKKESERVPDELPYFSPSPQRSPIPDVNSDTSESHKKSVSPPQSRSPGRSSSKSTERTTKHSSEKRGHHTPRSERPPSAVPSESSSHYHESGERKSRSGANKNSKSRDRTDRLPIHEPPQLLSPIPQHSPIPHFEKSNIVPAKIMVSIPLEKLLRLPGGTASTDCRFPKGGKSRPDEGTNSTQKSSSRDKVSKHDTSDKRSQSKDKIRTESSKSSSSSRTSKSGSLKKEKSSKVSSQPSESSKSKTSSSTVNSSKSSIKIVVDTTHCEESESQVSKKRKDEDEGGKQHPKKKLKVSSRPVEEKKIKEHLPIAKKDMTANSTESTGKIKSLERRDSSSSLSSLCSQQSQRSSKTSKEKLKDPHKNAPDAKRSKAVVSPSPMLTVKEIKQEKEEFPKVHIKKEPGLVPSAEKCKLKNREKLPTKDLDNKFKKAHETWNNDTLNTSSQYCQWEEPIKVEDSKAQLDGLNRDSGSDWDHFTSEIGIHKELKETSSLIKHSNQTHQHLMPMDYYWTEGKKQKQLAEKEKDPLLQVLKYFEATVLFILTSQQREEYSKDPDSVYKFYKQTLNFSAVINSSLQKLQSQYHNTNPGSTEFKLLILCLKCQSLLHVKLYNLKIKEIKEQQKGVSDFFRMHCPTVIHSARNPSHPSPSCQPGGGRLGGAVPSPHSPTPSPAGSVNSVGSQSSGYSSSDLHPMMSSRNPLQQTVNVPQNILDMICRQHTHLKELHDGHDLWEQADMYMTRSNLREFFKEVADQSEPLTLHSTIKDLVNYIQKGLSLVKKCIR